MRSEEGWGRLSFDRMVVEKPHSVFGEPDAVYQSVRPNAAPPLGRVPERDPDGVRPSLRSAMASGTPLSPGRAPRPRRRGDPLQPRLGPGHRPVGPRAGLAILRNRAISLLHAAGITTIAAQFRHFSSHPAQALRLVVDFSPQDA